MQLLVLYSFSAQPGSAELTINKDEILTLINKDIGDGWWEGVNDRGEVGLFPACYVEEYHPETAPPAEPTFGQQVSPSSSQQVSSSSPSNQQVTSSVQSGGFFTPNQTSQFRKPEPSFAEEPDWPEEDWDDGEDSGDNATEYGGHSSQVGYPPRPAYYGNIVPGQPGQMSQQEAALAAMGNLSLAEQHRLQASSSGLAGKPKKTLGQFSNFINRGLEGYIREAESIQVPLEDRVHIEDDPELGIVWKQNHYQYTCSVTKHGKESKMKGLKTYISYDITPSTTNTVVRRRYKHFDWLMQRMATKFLITPIPPLPSKQIAGRFEEDFVEHRRILLQLWVNYITRHPVLSQCDVWSHFIRCRTDDNMKEWKNGKRKAEKDELVEANFFHSIEVNPAVAPLDAVKTTKQLDNFQRFVSKFDESVKQLYFVGAEQSKRFSSVYAKDYKKLAEAIKDLASAFQTGTAWRNTLGLNEAIRQTSAAYEEIGRLFEVEPKYDFEPMVDTLHQYKGLLSSWPDILQLHKNVTNIRNEHERLVEEGKVDVATIPRVNQRANTITYATLAEINHFHNERLVDFKKMMQSFLIAQINFHADIQAKLQSALNKVNDA